MPLQQIATADDVARVVVAQSAKPDANGFIVQFSIAEVMESMVMPAAQVLWDAVAIDVTADGTVEKVPQTDEDCAQLRWTAVSLAEAANVLLIPGRHADVPGAKAADDSELSPEQIDALILKERGAWVAHAQVLHEVAMQMVGAIDGRDIEAVSEIGGTLDAACESCHLQFWYPEQ